MIVELVLLLLYLQTKDDIFAYEQAEQCLDAHGHHELIESDLVFGGLGELGDEVKDHDSLIVRFHVGKQQADLLNSQLFLLSYFSLNQEPSFDKPIRETCPLSW